MREKGSVTSRKTPNGDGTSESTQPVPRLESIGIEGGNMENPKVEQYHYQVNGRYRIMIERAASTKGVDGFKVEANGDDIGQVQADANTLYSMAKGMTIPLTGIVDQKVLESK